MADRDLLDVRVENGTGVIELSRPDKLNCLSGAMLDGMAAALDAFESDRSVRSVLLRAKGKTFCAGADLEEVKQLRKNPAALRGLFERGHRTMSRFESSPLPVVASVQGACLAGGLELVLCSDVVFAAASARFGDQHAHYGLFPGWGATQRLPRIVGPRRALDLMFSAAWLDASTAERWGLVSHVVEDASLCSAAGAYCAMLGRRSRPALAAMKRAALGARNWDLAHGLVQETDAAVAINSGKDSGEGINAFESKRDPRFLE